MGKSFFSMLCRSSATGTTSVSGLGSAGSVSDGEAASAGRRVPLRDGLVELALEVADLVSELRRILETELFGGGEHLLLELDDRLLDLRRRDAQAMPPARPRD